MTMEIMVQKKEAEKLWISESALWSEDSSELLVVHEQWKCIKMVVDEDDMTIMVITNMYYLL